MFALFKKKNKHYKAKYYDYLNSGKWKRIRHKVARRARYTCECCGKRCADKRTLKGFNVHHTTYEHLYDEDKHLSDLLFICVSCHDQKTKEIQAIKDKAKKDIAEVNRRKKN